MNTRALLVVGSFLAMPAWSQESAGEAPREALPTFDLSSASVRKILRDTAATQFASVQAFEAKPPEPKPVKAVQYVPPERPANKPVSKINLPTWPREEEHGSFSSFLVDKIFETVIEEVFNLEHDDTLELSRVGWVECQASIDLKRETLGQGSCNR
jgi:hypothetical protein